jgi:hypothetical protein
MIHIRRLASMAIAYVRPRKSSRSHYADLSGRYYTVEAVAVVDDIATGPKAIRDYLATQGYTAGAAYKWPLDSPTETDLASYLQRVDVDTETEDGLQYRVRLSYGPRNVRDDGPAQGDGLVNWVMAPWETPPELAWTSEEEEVHLGFDRDGNPLLNTAGDPFDPTIPTRISTPILKVTRTQRPPFLPAWITTYKNVVNDAEWQGFPAESVLCRDITADRIWDADHGKLWRTTYTFAFRPSVLASDGTTVLIPGWASRTQNTGRREIVYQMVEGLPISTGKLRKITDEDGQPVADPVPLAEDGTPLAAGDDVIYKLFNMYPKVDFGYFNFPADMLDGS